MDFYCDNSTYRNYSKTITVYNYETTYNNSLSLKLVDGLENLSTGTNHSSLNLGLANTVYNNGYSAAIGADNKCNNNFTFAFGNGNTMQGSYSFATGNRNTVRKMWSLSSGVSNDIGYNDCQTTLGQYLRGYEAGCTTIGKYNLPKAYPE
jgi:hypothetical protein